MSRSTEKQPRKFDLLEFAPSGADRGRTFREVLVRLARSLRAAGRPPGGLEARPLFVTTFRLLAHAVLVDRARERSLLPPTAALPTGWEAPEALDLPAGALADALDGLRAWQATTEGHGMIDLGREYEQMLGLVPVVRDGLFELVDPTSVPAGRDADRRRAGAWYTPDALVRHLLDAVLPAEAAEAPSVLDPACGSGNFLVAAARRLSARWGADRAFRALHGVDNDPVAVALCRAGLWLERGDPTLPLTAFDDQIRCADALAADWAALFPTAAARGGFDAVVGNPPFLNQLETGTAVGSDTLAALKARFGDAKGAYTDVATLFLLLGAHLLRPRGRLCLVQPLSLFAAKDAAVARARLASGHSVLSVWLTTERIFAASVFVCAVTLARGGPRRGLVTRAAGNAFAPRPPLEVDMDRLVDAPTWGHLVSDLLGVPAVHLVDDGTVADLADTTADFRDQFYGLVGTVMDAPPGAPVHPRLVVSGLVDPARCLWGERPGRFAGTTWARPVVDVHLLAGGKLEAWARGRLVPKLVIATQTRVIEAFADPDGTVLNTVPTITLTPRDAADLWRLLAVVLAPPVSAWALSRYFGAALSTDAIKLSARQVASIPLPRHAVPWQAAADLVRRASGPGPERGALLVEAGGWMCDAYGVEREPVLAWWKGRLPGSG